MDIKHQLRACNFQIIIIIIIMDTITTMQEQGISSAPGGRASANKPDIQQHTETPFDKWINKAFFRPLSLGGEHPQGKIQITIERRHSNSISALLVNTKMEVAVKVMESYVIINRVTPGNRFSPTELVRPPIKLNHELQ